jgi:hypothetical protein
MYVYVVRQRLSRSATTATNILATTEEILDASFSMSYQRKAISSSKNFLFRNIGGKARRRETSSKTKDVGGWIILKWILDRIRWYGLD